MKKLFSIALCVLPIVACNAESVVKDTPPGEGTPNGEQQASGPMSASGTIGTEGGTVEADGVTLEIPAGALAEETAITITKSTEQAPARHVSVTPLYKIEPSGLNLLAKKTAKLTFKNVPVDTVIPVIGAKKADGIFEGLTTTVANGQVYAPLATLADVFVAASDCKQPDGTPKGTLCKPAPAPATLKAQEIGGFALTGFEYWQWKKPDPYAGGNEVAWGYNGDGQPRTGVVPTEASRGCMAESYKTLETILKNDPPQELKELALQFGVHQFWFWNNDMTDAKPTVKVPKGNSELWLFQGSRGDGGLIKWISSTERDGTCKLPTREDLVLFAKGCLKTFPLNGNKGVCGSGK